jgi:hypothetical protein
MQNTLKQPPIISLLIFIIAFKLFLRPLKAITGPKAQQAKDFMGAEKMCYLGLRKGPKKSERS